MVTGGKMETVLGTVKNFVVLYLLVALLMQLIGDGKTNKYVRFFAGLVFLLLIMSPFYQMIKKKPMEQELYKEFLAESFSSQLEFDKIMGEYADRVSETAVDVLIKSYNDTLSQKGYEIKQYDCKMNEDDYLKEVKLYVGTIESNSRGSSGMTTQAQCAKECKALLEETWNPEFELKVYGRDGS